MGNEQLGEGSQGQSERPMKKAKYSWQVKGKSRSEMTDTSSRNNTVINVNASADSIATPSNSSITSYPRYLPATRPTKRPAEGPCNITRNCSEHEQCITERLDRGLARWQARQVAKGFVDNTINRILDSWLVAPLPGGANNSLGVEDAAILMAISAHGLQNSGPSLIVPQPEPSDFVNDLAQPSGSGISNIQEQVPVQQAPETEHFDFLEAAVAVAIQKKGLTPLSSLLPPSGQS